MAGKNTLGYGLDLLDSIERIGMVLLDDRNDQWEVFAPDS